MKIKQFINEKPRLKKTLKIIGVSITIFFASFGVICSGLLVGSCANQKTKEVVATTPIYHEKPIQQVFSFTTYDVYSTEELSRSDSFQNYINWVYEADGVDLYAITSNYDRGFTFGNDGWFVYSNILSGSNFESGGVDYMHLQNMTFHAEPRVTLDTNRNYQIFNLNFYSTTSNTKFLSIAFCRVYNGTLGGTYTWYTEGIYAYNNGNIEYYFPTLSLVVRNNSTQVAWCRQFFNFYGTSSSVSNDTYERGYNRGFENGKSRGYNNGYQQGYEAGVSSVTGVTSNPFDLIANAFGSIADILDIQILPGLNLGVLIFAPLVVTIIIVIVKMFRG